LSDGVSRRRTCGDPEGGDVPQAESLPDQVERDRDAFELIGTERRAVLE
jgi:hypothetical protein